MNGGIYNNQHYDIIKTDSVSNASAGFLLTGEVGATIYFVDLATGNILTGVAGTLIRIDNIDNINDTGTPSSISGTVLRLIINGTPRYYWTHYPLLKKGHSQALLMPVYLS